MAADGYVLKIPKSVLTKLDSADEKIKKLAETSRATQSTVLDAFTKMAAGIDPFISQAKTADRALKTFGSKTNTTSVNNTASALARVSVEMNKIGKNASANTAILAWKGLNENIKAQQDRLVQLNKSIKDYELTMSRINSGRGGSVSRTDTTAYEANLKEADAVRKTIAAYELKQQRIIGLYQEQKRQSDIVNKARGITTFSEDKKIAELQRLNEMYRNGTSELQKKAKAEDDAAKAAAKQAAANEKAAKAQERRNQAEQKQKERTAAKADREAAKAVEAYNNALNKSESTITQRLSKIEALRKAQEKLTATGRNYSKEIANISSVTARLQRDNQQAANSTDKLKSSQSKLLNTSDQLQRKLALVFSVSSIQGYIEKMVKVRGEFEIQQRALQAILQNKDEANAIWEKTVALAIKSPFTVKELVSYTKQLAAYRIESEKLYDTNKMLADVSAGLGVDMQRLILAYGQVKAANYLRGTELRQFSEAGINILGELSTYFSEIEERAISVGEVFNMVSKRMVSFEDVHEVFKRITSAGGIFYNMQEIQAETLQGQMSNLQDSLDIMFNEIGEANDGVLKGFVSTLRSIIENWESIADVMVPALTAFLTYKTVLTSISAYQATSNALQVVYNTLTRKEIVLRAAKIAAIRRERLGQEALNTTIKANPYVLIGSIILGIILSIISHIKTASKEQAKFNKEIAASQQNAREMVLNFKDLAETALDSTKSYAEQKEALKELNRTYGEILPSQSLTSEGLREMKGNYDAVTAAIYAKIEAQTKERMIQSISSEEGERLAEANSDVKNMLIDLGVSSKKAGVITQKLQKDIENGIIETVPKAAKEIIKLAKKIGGVNDLNFLNASSYNSVKKQFEATKEYAEAIRNINIVSINPDLDVYSDLWETLEKELNNDIEYVKEWKRKNEGELNPFELETQTKQKTIEAYNNFSKELAKKISLGVFKGDDLQIVNKFIEKSQKAIKELQGTQSTQWFNSVLEKSFEKVGANTDRIMTFFKKEDESSEEFIKRINDRISLLEKTKISYEKNPLSLDLSEEDYKKLMKQLEALKAASLEFPDFSKSNKKGESEEEKRLKSQISLLKKVREEYKKNLQYYSKEEALAKTKKDYENAFNESGLGSKFLNTMDLEPQGIIDALAEIGKGAGSKMRFIIEKEISDLKGDVNLSIKVEGIEKTKKELDDLFSSYELTVQLDKLGLNKVDISNLFDINPTSLGDIQNRLKTIFPEISKLSEEELKVYKDVQEKISGFQDNELKERLKKFAEYLSEAVDKVKKVQDEGALEISFATDFFEKGKLSAQQYANIIENVTKRVNDSVSKINTQKFKESPEYIQAMGDLSAYSTKQLQKLISKIKEFISASAGSLDASDLKVYTDALEKAQKQLSEKKSPFAKNAFSEFKQIKALQKDFNNQEKEHNRLLEEQEIKINNVKIATEKLAELKKQEEAGTGNPLSIGEEIKGAEENLLNANQSLQTTNNNLNISQGKMSDISSKMGQMTQGANAAMGMIDKIVTGIYQSINATLDLMNQFKELSESKGVDTEYGAWREVQQAGEVLGNVNERVMSSWNNFKSGNIAGAVSDAIGSITTIFTTFNRQHDKRRQQEIDRQIEKVKDLERAYGKLEKAINAAYSMDTLKESNKLAQQNIEDQIKSYEQMISSEQDKKDTDDNKIKEWRNTIEDLREKQVELNKELKESLGGFGTDDAVKSAANDFVSTWLDGFNEVGDGLDSLEENMSDWIQQMAQKQILAKLSNKYIKGVIESFDRMFDKDSESGEEVSKNELDAWRRLYEEKSSQFNDAAKAYMEAMGIKPTGSNKELDSLQQGIQSVTEDTAQALESLLNSMRFIVSDSNLALKDIVVLLGSDIGANPLLAEMRIQTALIRSINDLFSSVVSPGHPTMGGFALKVIV